MYLSMTIISPGAWLDRKGMVLKTGAPLIATPDELDGELARDATDVSLKTMIPSRFVFCVSCAGSKERAGVAE